VFFFQDFEFAGGVSVESQGFNIY